MGSLFGLKEFVGPIILEPGGLRSFRRGAQSELVYKTYNKKNKPVILKSGYLFFFLLIFLNQTEPNITETDF